MEDLNALRRAPPLAASLLASTMLTALVASPALAQTSAAGASGGVGLEEVVVTAQKRSENLQSVPVSIQALGTQKLDELNVSDFADYVKFLPSVSFKTAGPGFTTIYMRGIASGENANHSGPSPSVGVYLDEQPVTTITGPLEPHIYDIERVEALAGPQGTLYGASSESGTIRIITNKPTTTGFKAGYDLELNHVDHGNWGYTAEGFVNQPLGDRMAVRIVAWDEKDAGFIDNVSKQRTFPSSGYTTAAVNPLAESNYNDVDTYGARAALKIDLDDNWTVTPSLMAQRAIAHGNFAYDPTVGKLEVAHYYPEKSNDRWGQAALTIQGKVANFELTYAGAYMRRWNNYESDYADYSYFYDTLFAYGTYINDNAGHLINPSQYIQAKDYFTKQSHEFRIASPADQRARVVAGLFYERQSHHIFQRYRIDSLADSLEVPGWNDTLWLTKQLRVDKDYAAFGEASFDVTDALTVTGGIRFYESKNSLKGFFGFGKGFSSSTGEAACFGPSIVDGAPCTNLDKRTKDTGQTYKLNATWKFMPGKMVYATYSTGFRPGGINRRGTLPPYQPDTLKNYEAGWKTSWLDNRLRWNGAVYHETWNDFQFSFLGANGLTEIRNANSARVNGVESDINWLVTEGLTVFGSAAYTDGKLTSPYCNDIATDPKCLNQDAPDGQRLPLTPKFKGNINARYEWEVNGFKAHVQGTIERSGSFWGDLRTKERGILGKVPGYTDIDLTAGVEKDNWRAELFVKNLTDKLGETGRSAECAITVCGAETYRYPITPRTVGVKFGQSF